MSKRNFHIIVSGRVQGVSFRYFTYNLANSLGVVGTVQNLPTGEVEIFASGERDIMEQFISGVKNGPPLASVSDIKIEELEESLVNYKSFEII